MCSKHESHFGGKKHGSNTSLAGSVPHSSHVASREYSVASKLVSDVPFAVARTVNRVFHEKVMVSHAIFWGKVRLSLVHQAVFV